MKISELIEAAQKTLEEQGDIPVVVEDSGCRCCSMGTGLAMTELVEDEWVFEYGGDHRSIPLAFKVV